MHMVTTIEELIRCGAALRSLTDTTTSAGLFHDKIHRRVGVSKDAVSFGVAWRNYVPGTCESEAARGRD